MNIGFVGLGVMGEPMAGHLLEAGHSLRVYTRTRSKAADLLDRGAVWCESPAETAKGAEVVCTMLGFPDDVRQVYFDADHGLFSAVSPDTVLIDFTTSSPALAREIAERAVQAGASAVDAPVSGGDVGAQKGALSIMVGAKPDVFQPIEPLLTLLGANVVLQGPPGSGQACKLCNQTAIATTMIGVCEALTFARGNGLDPRTVLDSIGGGAAASWSLSNLAPRMLEDDLNPGFYVKHFVKDLTLAVEAANDAGLDLPGLELELKKYCELEERGDGDLGTQALIRLYTA